MTLQTLFNEIGAPNAAEKYHKDFSKYRIDGIDLIETDHIMFRKGNYAYDCKAIFYENCNHYYYKIERARPGECFYYISVDDMKSPPVTACWIASILCYIANNRLERRQS